MDGSNYYSEIGQTYYIILLFLIFNSLGPYTTIMHIKRNTRIEFVNP